MLQHAQGVPPHLQLHVGQLVGTPAQFTHQRAQLSSLTRDVSFDRDRFRHDFLRSVHLGDDLIRKASHVPLRERRDPIAFR